METTFQKIRVIGGAGCGKSTFAKKVAQQKGFELISLDHLDNKRRRGKNVRRVLDNKLAQNRWIVEGVQYHSVYKKTISQADIVIFMDYPLYLRQIMLVKRAVQLNLGLSESNRKCHFSQLIGLMQWNKQFEHDRIELEYFLRDSHVEVIHVKSRSELLNWYDKHLK